MVSFVSSDESKREEVKRIDRKRVLKWVLLVTVPQTVLDATASLRTASVRQDQRKYCVLVLRTHPVGSVVRILFRPETHCVLVLRTHPVGSVVRILFRPETHCVLVLRTHPVGSVVRILFRPETHCVLVLRTHPVGSVVSSEQANFSNRRLICMQGETTSASVQTETTPQTKVHPHHYTRELFHHEPHQYQPRNVNRLIEAEKAAAAFNTRVAVP